MPVKFDKLLGQVREKDVLGSDLVVNSVTWTSLSALPTASSTYKGRVVLLYGGQEYYWDSLQTAWDSMSVYWDDIRTSSDHLYICLETSPGVFAWTQMDN